ncbi:Inactive tyrosine-protein kinase transmembrane receptor ROR1 [Holothuria leucospilota]|uniref:Inactive tyrosine-protein kinase transmembrane receptor ROR1 n=1 Tax=Holothuria leucospilota TaxID=206669 RepID=A0A9Q1H7B5_HOLLE|nr:Inactive tyrosine-protein kinase transmembrane receptor ROR1 [Holothuria leucospilota]
MIYEYLEFGSLRDFVRTQFHERGFRQEEESILQLQQLLTLASDIASAMVFIVSQNFAHPALSLKKVLLSEQCKCKLYDIYPRDMAMMKINNVIKKSHSRIAWMPPETIFLSTYSSSSDIWSFAVTLWELFSLGETPYAGRSIEEIEHNIRTSIHLPKPPDCPEAVYEVMLNSWAKNDKARPSFVDIKQKLQSILSRTAKRIK